MSNIKYCLVIQLLFSFCLCEVSNSQKEKFLNGFKVYYNSLPNQVYRTEEGALLSTQPVDDTTYQIVASIKVAEIKNVEATKLLQCTATVKDSDNDVTILNNDCEEVLEQKPSADENQETTLEAQAEVTEPTVERKPVQLVNEVQADTAITSGEQFIAIPRDQPSAPCIGCASHVNPQAAGVSDLAKLGLRHLTLHEPSVVHKLDSVIDVERQVQVVNGVRYVLTLLISSDNCTEVQYENCASTKICKITILAKPWVKLSNGGNYRAILANNCTEEWQYGDNGEVLPELSVDDNQSKESTSVDPSDSTGFDGDIQVKHHTNVESQPNKENTLTDEDIKKIQEQIISNTQFQEATALSKQSFTLSPDVSDASKQHVFKVESGNHNENTIPVTESEKTEQASNINLDKKKAIDELLDFFDFSGFKPKSEDKEVLPRIRRSYDYDLQVLSLAKDYHGIKNSIENARFMYEMAQAMVDYLNEMDMEVKNRAVKNVMKAEEETENHQRFVYVQARVTIPCDKVECEPRDVNTQICNGVIECSNKNSPQILNTFCYNDNKESEYREDVREISLNDPVLRKMAEDAVKKIESDSKSQYAMKINKIVSAVTQITSGTLTKFSVIVENIKCNKSVPMPLRINCTILEQLGSKICDVIVHDRHELKKQKISYTCTERPSDMRISKSKKVKRNVTVDDPEINEMLQEVIQYLESQSDKTNKQKIVSVKSISSQIIAGFLTKIEFIVGYTDCTDDNYPRDQIIKCELLKGEGLRSCRAQIWDRSWIMDGRQIEVSCDDASKTNEIENTRKKRSIDTASDREQQRSSKYNDIDYEKLAKESLYRFMESSASHQHYEVVKVDKAIVQDVSRKLIKIDFSISPTDCLIQTDGTLSLSQCEIVDPKNILHCHSKILQNNWIDKKQYFVKCNIKYHQKNNTNVKERAPSDPKYYQLAKESLAKYLHDTGNPHHIIVKVEKVTTQIVSGLLTRMDFIISPKNYSVSNKKNVRCHSEILEKRWLETKEFNVSCQMKKKEGLVKINTDDPKYMQIAVESLQKYIKDKTESNLVRVVFVDKVEQKGGKIKMEFIASHAEEGDGDTLCYAEVSETTDPKSDIEVKCQLIGKIYRNTKITEDDLNYYKYVQLADEAIGNYLQKTNSLLYTLVSIESVSVQWDGGIKTHINFTISSIDSENNELIHGKQCFAEILEQPWLHEKDIEVQCELEKDLYRTKRQALNSRVRRQLVYGGAKEQDASNPKYKTLAEESLRKYTIDSGITQPLKVERIVKVTIVSGTLTSIDFLVSGISDSETIKCHSRVWERAWLNSKEIDISCESDGHLRGKRELVGGTKDQDPTEPQYKMLAEESLRKYSIDSGITQPLKVERIVKVTTQVVSGTLTSIDFLVSGISDSETIKCHSRVWERAWLNSKEIDISCESDGHLRGKRELVGGTKDQDPTEPQYKMLAEESLRKYSIDSGITQPLKVERIVKVTTQVVSGTLTSIDFLVSGISDSETIKCHSRVWERAWLNSKEIDISCESDGHLRGKRELVGGTKDQDPTEPQYKMLAEESLRKYSIDSGITQPLKVERIVKVTTQVVSGTLTSIDFLVSGISDSETIKCHSRVWERAWLNSKEIDISCESDGHLRGKRELVGGTKDQDPTEPQYKMLAEESLRKYSIDSGITQPLKVERIVKVTTQVVSGTLTSIDFLVSGISDSETIKCHSRVWERAWLNSKEIDISCESDGHLRGKRELVGGTKDQDPTEPQYKMLAEESLRKYSIDSGITQPLKVERIVKVTTQVVSGTLTSIDFLVSGISDSETIKCHSRVWERAWLNSKEIDISCESDGHLRGKRELVGGTKDQDPTEPQYKMLAEESLRKYVLDSGITEALVVTHVEKVTTQIVAGTVIRIDFLVSGSPDSEIIKCHSEVWDRPWLKRKDKSIRVSCENDGHRRKRQLEGGLNDQDPTEPRYKALAEESLQKYITEFAVSQPFTVVHVEKVTTQVVAGILTRIDFLISESQNSKTMKCHSKVLEQAWLNIKDIKVSCENDSHRRKRQVAGGLTDHDPTEPRYKALAEESLQKYITEFAVSQPFTVVHVEKVTTQVVAGILTRIDFLISESQNSKTMKCHSKVLEQAWLNIKDIKVSCENDSHRRKRQVAGGLTDHDPTEPRYKALAEESLQKYITEFAVSQPFTVVHVEKVTTQVVAGILTRIDFLISESQNSKTMKCHSKVLEQAWLNIKDIKVSCENDSHRRKRQVAGGLTDHDPTEPRYKALAEESLQKFKTEFAVSQPFTVVHVEKVTTQVVAGILTRIDFLISESQNSKTMKCHSKVLEQAWLNIKDIKVSCENDSHRRKRQVAGGLTDHDPTEPRYKALAEESLQKYITEFAVSQPFTVVHVEKVTTQVVAGILTRIDFLISESQSSKTMKCHSKVLEQAWLNIKDIKVSCENDSHRRKRQVAGGLTDRDPTEPQYKALAEESLQKYITDFAVSLPLKVLHVEKVTTQVVAGSLTRIDFTVSSNLDSDRFKCHSEVWDRPWLKEKDINVTCLAINKRVIREMRLRGGASEDNLIIPEYKMLAEESIQGNISRTGHQHVGMLRGSDEEEQDPNKSEYKRLAEESLRKLYQKKSTVYHKVVEVNRVVTRVVSGLKYKIDFTAAPTACSVNVSSLNARNCKAVDARLYCHSDIWDQPWLKRKKIDIQCNGPTYDNDDSAENESDNDPQKNNIDKYMKLAEEASEKYLTTSNRKYVHKVTDILSTNEQVTDGTLIKIDYSLSPTTCLRNETTNNTSCNLKQPLVVFNCNASIQIRPWLDVEKEISVTCKRNSKPNGKKHKRESGLRNIREIDDEDDELDEDTAYYYADRAVQHINDKSNSNNLHKLISIHDVQSSVQMGTLTIKMYIEVAETYCLRHHKSKDLRNCEEMSGLNHRLCLSRLWPSPDDELIVRHVSVICDDEEDFVSVTGVNIPELMRISVAVLESNSENKFKLVHQGEPQVIPSLNSRRPFKLYFIIGVTNCSKDVDLSKDPFQCYLNPNVPARSCHSFIWLKAEAKYVSNVDAQCTPVAAGRYKRSVLDSENVTSDYSEIQKMMTATLEQLEMQSLHRYKQRILQINSHSTRITSGKVTTIDFDVGYTSCLKYEWVANITSCNFLDHLPRRRCVAQIWERLWISNGRNIDVNCVDDETPLESHIEFESAEMANELAEQALKHIEAKYPHPSKQKVVRIFSLEKQVVAGIHYKMKVEVGYTDCLALSDQKDCKLLQNHGLNKFCRVNVWIRPWTDHPPNFRVSCDFQEGTTHDLYHHVQAEHLFYNFLTTYSPSYVNDYSQMHKRFEIFKNNVKKIHELNIHEKGTAVYGVTRFTDLTYEEFSTTYMGLKTNLTNENQVPMKHADIPNIKIPTNFDWRDYDAVTDVKDQGSCGSCWAFSVTGNIEGQWKMQSGQLVSLSEQELVDCDKLDNGCNGGLPDNAYRAIEQMGGLELESDYPYEGADDKCVFNKTLAKVKISSAVNITTNETGMAQWLVQNGPISIGINANAMQFYMGGISHPWKMLCNPTNLDHGVLIVGFGVKDYPLFHKQLPYWIVKNSWGKSWGEQGYYRVFRGDGTCGVNQMASSAVI